MNTEETKQIRKEEEAIVKAEEDRMTKEAEDKAAAEEQAAAEAPEEIVKAEAPAAEEQAAAEAPEEIATEKVLEHPAVKALMERLSLLEGIADKSDLAKARQGGEDIIPTARVRFTEDDVLITDYEFIGEKMGRDRFGKEIVENHYRYIIDKKDEAGEPLTIEMSLSSLQKLTFKSLQIHGVTNNPRTHKRMAKLSDDSGKEYEVNYNLLNA